MANSKVLVSVIVPNYCHSNYLDQRIQSILNQTYQDFELIILDDCSPDNGASRNIIEKYRDNFYVSQIIYNDVNSGSPFKQWDKGIRLAKGELIWIAESDDYCEYSFLESLVEEFERNDSLVLAYTLSKHVDKEGNYIGTVQSSLKKNQFLDGYDFIRRFMTLNNHCVNASACLFRKSAYMNVDREYVSYKASGDWLFWIEIAEQGNVTIVNRRLNYFRQQGANVTQSAFINGITLREFKKTYDYVNEHVKMSFLRKWIMKKNVRYLLERMKFQSEDIREELFEYWNLTRKLSFCEITAVRIVRVLQGYSIYL